MSFRIPEHAIAEVRDRADILRVVERHVKLKKTGRNWSGLCPFHADKDPSFTVSPERRMFHCFGCGKGGDVFRFLMELEGKSFPDAIREVAEQFGVTLPEREVTADERRSQDRRTRLIEVNEAACRFFQDQLAAPAGRKTREYLARRDTPDELIESFRIGSAPDAWEALESHFKREKIPLNLAEELGLVARGKRGGHYDVFRGRVIFPIMDRRGKVIAFGGRLMEKDAKGPKYLNSPASAIYDKGSVLYGLYQARAAISREGAALIAEGYFDVLAMVRHGFTHTVAPCGTALTQGQLTNVRRQASRVFAVFDGDPAGLKAAERAIPLFLRAGLDARRVRLPDGLDPDDYLGQEGGKAAFGELLEEAPPVLEDLIDRRAAAAEQTAPGKARAAAEISEYLKLVENRVERDLYLKRLAERLGVDEAALRSEALPRKAHGERAGPPRKPEKTSVALSRHEEFLIHLLLLHPELGLDADDLGAAALVSSPVTQAVLAACAKTQDTNALLDVIEDEALRIEFREKTLQLADVGGDSPGAALEQCISRIRGRRDADRQKKLVNTLGSDPSAEELREIQDLAIQRKSAESADPGEYH